MILALGVGSENVRLLGLADRSRLANLTTAEEVDAFLALEPAVWECILLGPALDHPLRAAQRVKARNADALVLVLATSAAAPRLQHELLLTPVRGEPVRVVPLDEAAPRAIEQHLTHAKLRRRQTQALRAADMQMPGRPATPLRIPAVVERFFEAAPGAVFLLDEAGHVVHANRIGRALLPASARGARLVDALPVGDREALRVLLERADPARPARVVLQGEPPRTLDAVAAPAQPAPDRQGTLVTLHDVTPLVEAERERERQARLHRTLLDAQSEMGVAIIVVEGGAIRYVNDAYIRLTGFTEEELRALPLMHPVAPEERALVQSRYARRLRGEDVESLYESVVLRKDGARVPVEVSVRSLGEGGPTVVLMRDTSARKRMMGELDETRRAVAQMDKLASMGSLVGGLAHEIRTPLTAIMNHAGLLDALARRARAGEDPAALADALPGQVEGIHESVDRIRGLVKDLHRFMRGEAPNMVEMTLDAHVADAARLFQATQRGRVHVEASLASTRRVLADPAQVQQVVINLLQNAAEASPSGGTVWVRTRDAEGGVEVEVEDRGSGIPPDLRARMFEAFVTTKPGGTGLGLTIVRRLAEIHRARVRVDTEPGRGSRFTLAFPAA